MAVRHLNGMSYGERISSWLGQGIQGILGIEENFNVVKYHELEPSRGHLR